jgi:DNA-binding response OmpR family regulator
MHSILAAEDDPSILISLEFLLKNAGYAVTTADHGERAWLTLQKQSFDLIVLDVMLPGIDGLELCRRIRTTKPLKAAKILLLSARGRDSEIDAGLRLGADAYMTKPFGTREFLDTVAQLLASEHTT